ncbi:MAG: ABC transporter permease [bacterium]
MIDLFFLLKEEIKRNIIMRKRYAIEYIAGLILMYGVFIGMFAGLSHIKMLSDEKIGPYLMIGYLMWQIFGWVTIEGIADELGDESILGTIQQIYISSFKIMDVLLCRTLAKFILGSGELMIMLLAIFLTTGEFLYITRISVIIPFVLTLMGLYGFGLSLAGLNLVFKRVRNITEIITWALFFLAGVMIPLEFFPPIIQFIGKTLPLTQGIEVLRTMIIEQKSLIFTLHQGDLFLLMINSGVYLLLGIYIFKIAEKIALRRGIIGYF